MAHAIIPIHGMVCRVEKGGVVMEFTEGWTIHAEVDLEVIARQGKNWKEKLAGMGDWSGSFNGQLVLGNTQQKAIIDNIINTTPGSILTDIEFNLDVTANYFSGDCFIKSVDIDAPVAGKLGFTVNIEGNDALTLNP